MKENLVTMPPPEPIADCPERVRLEREHVFASTEWINAGGEDRLKAKDPAVIAAAGRLAVALKAMTEHRQEHGC